MGKGLEIMRKSKDKFSIFSLDKTQLSFVIFKFI